MALSSMTAFSRVSETTEFGQLVWEVRSVNHRYLEMSIRMPDSLRYLEPAIRQKVQKSLKRGKLDLTLQYQPNEKAAGGLVVNAPLVRQLSEVEQQLAAHFSGVTTNMIDILRWPGVLEKQQNHLEALGDIVLTALDSALVELVETRQREGAALSSCLNENLLAVAKEIAGVSQRMPEVLAYERSRVLERIDSLKLTVEEERFEQEMVWLAQKADIAEECQRVEAHVAEVDRVLKQGGVVGRRLDFLMQELNREANTIASKSLDTKTTQSAVEMKVLIEQMREQVQNVE